jgi:glycosyltransferase 2 family protein
MLLSLAFGIVVVGVLGAYADYRAIIGVLRHFDWAVLPVVLLLTAFNYFGRFLKWQFYLGRLASRVPTDVSLLIFISGFSMVLTPGKVGELLKSYLLKQVSGTPMARSAPIVLAERLTDGVALLLLGSVGLLLYRRGWEALVAIFALAVLVVLVIQSRPLSLAILVRLERLPLLSRVADHLRAAYASSYLLLRLDALLIAIGLGILSWSGECLAFYVILHGLHLDQQGGGLLLLVKAAFILASSTLVGSASLLPGGLGVADGGIAGLLHVLLGTPPDVSVAATLLIRFCTLWFGVALGAGALALFGQRYGKPQLQLEGAPPA